MRKTQNFQISRFCAVALAAFATFSANATDHVLTITINDYAPNASVGALDGVLEDRRNALTIAQRLGLDTRSAIQLQNKQATLLGIRTALDNLERAVSSNDRVFVYYSGHGGTKQVSSICQSSLITYEDEDLLSSEFYERLNRIKNKAPQKLFVMIDSCHSGQFTEQNVRAKNAGVGPMLRAKMRIKSKDGQPTCNAPVNFVVEGIEKLNKSRQAAKGTMNENLSGQMVMLSAARDNEVAWDGPQGGAATSAALRCLSEPGLQSAENNGFISAEALRLCAQTKLDNEQPLATRQHLVAHGQATAALVPVQSTDQVTNALRQIATSGSNGNWAFQVTPTASTVSLAEPDQRRVVRFPYSSSQAGYGYVLYVGTDGKDMKQLFPEPGENNFLPAQGEFPALSIDPPAGANIYLFVMSQTPKDFDGIFQNQGNGAGETTAFQCELTKRNSGRVKVGNECADRRNSGRVLKPMPTSGVLEGYAAQVVVVNGR